MSSKNKNKQNKNSKPEAKTSQAKEAKKQDSNEDPLTVQNELLAKMAMLKQQLGQLKGQGQDGLGSEMFDDLFSTLMGQMDKGGLAAKPVNRQEYIDSEQAHQESMAIIDETLESRLLFYCRN
jgi:hypothetical protein